MEQGLHGRWSCGKKLCEHLTIKVWRGGRQDPNNTKDDFPPSSSTAGFSGELPKTMKAPRINDTIKIIDMRPQGQRALPYERQVQVTDKNQETFTTNEGTFYTSTGWHTEHEIRAFA